MSTEMAADTAAFGNHAEADVATLTIESRWVEGMSSRMDKLDARVGGVELTTRKATNEFSNSLTELRHENNELRGEINRLREESSYLREENGKLREDVKSLHDAVIELNKLIPTITSAQSTLKPAGVMTIRRSKDTLEAEKLLKLSATKNGVLNETTLKDHLSQCTAQLMHRANKRVQFIYSNEVRTADAAGRLPKYGSVYDVIDETGHSRLFLDIVQFLFPAKTVTRKRGKK